MNKPQAGELESGDQSPVADALDGELGIPNVAQAKSSAWSRKGVLAGAVGIVMLLAVSGLAVHRAFSNPVKEEEGASKRPSDRPSASATSPRTLDISPAPGTRASEARPVLIPAIVPSGEEAAEPIGVRRTGTLNGQASRTGPMAPEDAPVLLVASRAAARDLTPESSTGRSLVPVGADAPAAPDDSLQATKRNLQAYQHQLQGLMDNLTQQAALATGGRTSRTLPGAAEAPTQALASLAGSPGAGLFGGQLQGSATARVAASTLGDRSLTLPKGTAFTCALKTKVISAASGFVGCQVQRNVYGDNGHVLLIERGSHLDGEYRIGSVRPGMVRIPVLWTRIRTPQGVTVDIDSPGTGQLGESGIDGYVDNRWPERIGAAMLLSLIEDAVQITLQNQSSETQADTVVMPATTSSTSRLAEKVLDSTINIPPLIYQNQGAIVGIYVARDVDFSTVYTLEATAR